MTPAAAQLFRNGTDDLRRQLAQCQFFECTALMPLAMEMGQAEQDLSAIYSEMAHLPSPFTVLEVMGPKGRHVLICHQDGADITIGIFIPTAKGPVYRAKTGFTIGTNRTAATEWQVYPGEDAPEGGRIDDERDRAASWFANVVEKLLCIINQPGLVGSSSRPTDKRILREAAKSSALQSVPTIWHEYRIRPGHHGEASKTGDGAPRQLHYVRKHWKPSVSKWIDGYWRGNADLGVHLKWYETKSLVG